MAYTLVPIDEEASTPTAAWMSTLAMNKPQIVMCAFDAECRRAFGIVRHTITVTRTFEDETFDEQDLAVALLLWDVATGTVLQRFEGYEEQSQYCGLSQDGTLALSAAEKGPVRLWDVASGTCLRTYSAIPGDINRCRFVANDQLIAIVANRTILLIDVAEMMLQQTIPFTQVSAISPNGHSFVDITSSRPVIVVSRDLMTGAAKGTCTVSEVFGLTFCCALSDDGRLVLVVQPLALQPSAYIWDVVAGQRAVELRGAIGFARKCLLSPDGTLAVIASDSGTRVWDAVTGRCLLVLLEPKKNPWPCAFNTDGSRLAIVGADATVAVYETVALQARSGHTATIYACVFSTDGNVALTASGDQTLYLWDVATHRPLRVLVGHTGPVDACAFSPDGAICASASRDHTLRVWEVASGRCLHVLRGHCDQVSDCAFSPDGQRLVSVDISGMMLVWDVANGALIHNYLSGAKYPVYTACAYAPDGKRVVATNDQMIFMWDVASLLPAEVLNVGDSTHLQFSPDGQQLLLGGRLQLLDSTTGQLIRQFTGIQPNARGCVMSADGTLVAACDGGQLMLWDCASGMLLAQWEGSATLYACAIDPRNATIIVGDGDGRLHWLRVDVSA